MVSTDQSGVAGVALVAVGAMEIIPKAIHTDSSPGVAILDDEDDDDDALSRAIIANMWRVNASLVCKITHLLNKAHETEVSEWVGCFAVK